MEQRENTAYLENKTLEQLRDDAKRAILERDNREQLLKEASKIIRCLSDMQLARIMEEIK